MVDSEKTGEKLWTLNAAVDAGSQQIPRPSLSSCYYPILQELGNCSFTMVNDLPTVTEMGDTWVKAISIIASMSPVGLFYFCRSLALLAYFVCVLFRCHWVVDCFYGSAWEDSLLANHSNPEGCVMLYWPHLFWRVSLGLHLLMFTKKAAWVSVSPGALFSVRKWSDYAFRVFFYFIHIKSCQSTCLLLSSWERPSCYNQEMI